MTADGAYSLRDYRYTGDPFCGVGFATDPNDRTLVTSVSPDSSLHGKVQVGDRVLGVRNEHEDRFKVAIQRNTHGPRATVVYLEVWHSQTGVTDIIRAVRKPFSQALPPEGKSILLQYDQPLEGCTSEISELNQNDLDQNDLDQNDIAPPALPTMAQLAAKGAVKG